MQIEFHQSENLLRFKEHYQKFKRQITEYEKIFANYIYDKGCVTKIYREILKLSKKMTSKPIKTLGKLFSYSFDQISTVIIKKLQKRNNLMIPSVGNRVEKMEPLYNASRNAN